ncbi:MAG: crossover junction endodeoxyribonuclease RuvC [Caldithrix sp.]|nr:crossover junction endodeoxyribonuclease RuvC [Caldithrix sp.]
MGIDPGLNITGYGLINISDSDNPQLSGHGYIRTNSRQSLADRLKKIYSELFTLIQYNKPDIVAIENIFYAENVKTAIVMGHARGAAIVAAVNNEIDVKEYSPREIKMSVVGNGAAGKMQVRYMVANLLGIREEIEPDDASDALAVALCHWHRSNKVLV